jgi:DNA-binding IclR family transcriptional regulator
MKTASGVAAVDRALTILDVFRGTDGVLSLAAISAKTGLYKSTILRLMTSLEAYGYVRRLEGGRYQIGPKVSELSAVYQASFKLSDFVIPALKDIVEQVNENASFYIREKECRVCLFRVEAKQVIRDHIQVGDALPLGQGASGKVLQQFDDGITKKPTEKEFVIVSFGERHPDMAAVAAPVFGTGDKLIGALSISGPRSRFTPKVVKDLTDVVRVAAVDLSLALGASPVWFDRLCRRNGVSRGPLELTSSR